MREEREKEKNDKGIFYGVIGVATLIVAIIGATFAWFTATAGNESVTVRSGTLIIEYLNGSFIAAENLKPATTDQIVARQDTCILLDEEEDITEGIDAEHICAKYSFTVRNSGTLRAVMGATVAVTTNTYPAGVIKYVLVQGLSVNAGDVASPNTFAGSFTMPSNVSLAPEETASYTLLIWLDENAVNSGVNDASNKSLVGTLSVTANQTNYVETP